MSKHSYYSFFHQQKKRSIQRRARKPLDLQALFGEKREPVLTFFQPGKDREADEDHPHQINRPGRPPSARSVRSGRPPSASSTRRKSQVILPPLDPTGPHLTAQAPSIADDLISERKKKILQSIEEGDKEVPGPQPKYKFNEIKFASTSILSNLARRLDGQTTSECLLPEELVDNLRQDFFHLVEDTIVDRREWQTDCYIDYRPKSRFPFLTSAPEDWLRQELDASLSTWVVKEDIKRRAKQKMLKKAKKAVERPQTAKSVASIRSDISGGSHEGDRESRAEADYDKLPPELRAQGPAILRYRRESQAPKPKVTGPKTRLEKLQGMITKSEQKTKKVAKISILSVKPVDLEEQGSSDHDQESYVYHTPGDVVHFTMTEKNFAEQGWIVRPSQQRDPEGYTLMQWANSRLKESMRQREESMITAKLRGEDGQLVAKYYSDAHSRSLRGGRHHRAASFPLPAILTKLPPSIASFTSPGSHEAFQVNNGLSLCLLQLPDGSGYVNYYSGRRALSLSRRGDGSRGVYTVVYDDTEASSMLAFFMPTGNACCYHRNGAIHMLSDAKGGALMDEDGNTTRKWAWPSAIEKMGYPVTLQLNSHLVLLCSGVMNMTLKFSCHGQMHRFPVGLVPAAMEDRSESFWLTNDTISDQLQSNLPLYSHNSKFGKGRELLLSSHDSRAASTKPHSRERLASSVSQPSTDQFMADEDGLTGVDELQSRKELDSYREKITSLVNDWMGFYQQKMGVRPMSRHSPLLQSSGGSQFLLNTYSHRAATTIFSTSRPPTHSSSRAHSRLGTHPLTSSFVSRATTPAPRPDTSSPRPMTPLDFVQRQQSQEQLKPFKVGPAKPRPQPPRPSKLACPFSLHEKFYKNKETLSQCRCDKRQIPLVRDLEFDELMQNHVPKNQLVIICVTSSRLINPLPCEPLLETLHLAHNRNRFSPCQQCTIDPYRILKYDLVHALDNINMDVPLLVDRHNVFPGMFLMFMSGRLVDANTGFNGYGNTKRDLLKQIQRSLENGRKGQFLPKDYKFAPPSSCKLHSHSLWAYPVSGVLDEFVSYTPSSVNSSSAHSLSAPERIVTSKLPLSMWADTQLDVSFSKASKLSSSVSKFDLQRED